MTRLYLLDLDRTAFNTSRFVQDLVGLMERIFKLDPEVFEAGIKQYVLPGEIGYDFYAHATAATSRSKAEIHEVVSGHFKGADYTYPDVAPWLARTRTAGHPVVIVTVGEPDYQSLKYELATPLAGLPLVVVSQNKGLLLRETLANPARDHLMLKSIPYTAMSLVDDNPKTFTELGPGPAVSQWRIARPGEKFTDQPAPGHVTSITSFEELS